MADLFSDPLKCSSTTLLSGAVHNDFKINDSNLDCIAARVNLQIGQGVNLPMDRGVNLQ